MKPSIGELKRDITFDAELRGNKLSFRSTWGLFSPAAIDAGSRLLIEEMEISRKDAVLDVGCGYGAIGIAAASLASEGKAHLVDKDFVAVEYAKKNIAANGLKNTEAYLSNLFSGVPPQVKFDVVLSNPPAQGGRELLSIFLNDAYARLNPGGKLYVVTVSGLKEFIKRNFEEVFGNYRKIRQSGSHVVALALNPVRT